MTVYVQQTTASASSSANNAGLASFDSTDFDVDGNGYVTFVGSAGTETLTGNSGGIVGPTGGNINTVGSGSITIVGNPGTSTLSTELTGLNNHNVLVGAGTATITNVSPSTAGFVLTSNGTSSDPSFQAPATSGTVTSVSVVSANGFAGTVANPTTTPAITLTTTITGVLSGNGTAISGSAITQHDVLVGGTSNAITSVSPSTAGFVLTSNGTGADPSFQAASGGSGITTIDGDTGSITGSTVTIFANVASLNCGSTVQFTNSGTTSTFNVSDANSNTIIGGASGNATVSGFANIGVGSGIFDSLAGGNFNSAFGPNCLSTVSSGSSNTACGSGALTSLGTGSFNLGLGAGAGGSYSSSESNNICIGTNGGSTAGTPGDSGVIRIGDIGVNTTCFISGINNSDSSGFTSPLAVFVDSSTGQLGFGSGGGGGITTINGDSGSITGSTVTIFANNATQNCGSSVQFTNSSTTSTLNLSDSNSNTMLGLSCGNATISGYGNTCLGGGCCQILSSGYLNTCIGGTSGQELQDGYQNTFCGDVSGTNVISGFSNVCIGYSSNAPAMGSYNVGIGYFGGASVASSNYMISIGTTGGSLAQDGVIEIGNNNHTACLIQGIDGVTVTGSAVLINSSGQLGDVVSSQRFKKDIHDLPSNDILKLRPVAFKYIKQTDEHQHFGLIAEEVEKIFPELVLYDKEHRPYSVMYHEMPVLLLAEIQKLRKELDELKLKMSA